jgi:hypothetical protein
MTHDNLDAAAANETKNLTRRRTTGANPGEGTNQVLIRASAESHERWKTAAANQGISMAEFVRTAADTAAAKHLDCPHGADQRRWYPWAEVCLKCGLQLRDGKQWLIDPHTISHVRPLDANPAVR